MKKNPVNPNDPFIDAVIRLSNCVYWTRNLLDTIPIEPPAKALLNALFNAPASQALPTKEIEIKVDVIRTKISTYIQNFPLKKFLNGSQYGVDAIAKITLPADNVRSPILVAVSTCCDGMKA